VARLGPLGSSAYAAVAARFGVDVPAERLEDIAARLQPIGAPGGTTDAFLAESRGELGD
jgi:hypothetical protein